MHADNFLQVDTMILMGMLKHLRIANLQFLCNISKKKLDTVVFLHGDKHQSFLQVHFNTLDIRVSYKVILSLLMSIIKYSQSTQTNKFPIS